MDWIDFLESHHIPYDIRGKNVSGDHVAIACPFCAGTDPSRHLVINLGGAGWHCWRNRQHRGRSPVRLICVLLNCSVEQARAMAGENHPILSDDLVAATEKILTPAVVESDPVLVRSALFKPFVGQYTSQRFVHYLRSRGFPPPIEDLSKTYDMYYAVTGPFFGRVLFMVRSLLGEIMGWTGRSIYPEERLRYRSEGPIGHYLLWLDRLPRPKSHTLVLCEGPMDALKVNVFGRSLGVDATCCFTSSPTRWQVDHILGLGRRYRRNCVMLDRGEVANMLVTTDALSTLRPESIWMPARTKDPGDIGSVSELAEIMGLASI